MLVQTENVTDVEYKMKGRLYMKKTISVLLVTTMIITILSAMATTAFAASNTATLNGNNVKAYGDGLTFKGFGVLSANSTSALLLDYKSEFPEKYWELVNVLFGGDHPIFTHVKIEMGNDGNNSTGAEPAPMRPTQNETTANASRSTGLVLAADAKKINPNVKVSGIQWNVPTGITRGANDGYYNWYKQTIFDCYEKWGYIWDYIGPCTNESSVQADWVKYFKDRIVNENSFPANWPQEAKDKYRAMKFIADDQNNGSTSPMAVANAMNTDAALRDIIDAMGSHYSRGNNESTVRSLVTGYNKEVWYSEASAAFSRVEYHENKTNVYGTASIGGRNSALSPVDSWMAMLVNEYKTHAIFQPAIMSFYGATQYNGKGYIDASEPWSGYLHYDESIYILKHFTDFAVAGWSYDSYGDDVWIFVPDASANSLRPSGGHANNASNAASFATFVAPDKSAFSTVVVNNSGTANTQTVNFSNMNLPAGARYYIWRTMANSYMQLQNPGGTAISGTGISNIAIPAYSCVTITTVNRTPDRLPAESASLPLDSGTTGRGFDTGSNTLYADDFGYADEPAVPITTQNGASESLVPYMQSRGNEPRYMQDGSGAWQVENGVLRQVCTSTQSEWNSNSPITRFGDHKWMNYAVSVDAIPGNTSTNACVLSARNIIGQGISSSGYRLSIARNGAWNAYKAGTSVSSGNVTAKANGLAYRLKIECNGNVIRFYIDGVLLYTYTDSTRPWLFGRVALGMGGWYAGGFDNLLIEKIDSAIPYATRFVDNGDDDITYSGSWTHRVSAAETGTSPGDGDSMDNWYRSTSWKTGTATTNYMQFKVDGTGFALVGNQTTTGAISVQTSANGDSGWTTAQSYTTDGAAGRRGAFIMVNGITPGYYARVTFTSSSYSPEIDGVYIYGGTLMQRLTASPGIKDFGKVAAGYSSVAAQMFTIKCEGTTGATGISATLGKGSNSPFEITSALDATSLASGATSTIAVRPKSGFGIGKYTDLITIPDDSGAALTVYLSFEVIPPYTVSPGSKDFGSEETGYAAIAPQTYTITNNTENPLTVTKTIASGVNFTITNAGGVTIPALGTSTFTVAPNIGLSPGAYADTITITNGAISNAISVSFTVIDPNALVSVSDAVFACYDNGAGLPFAVTALTKSGRSVRAPVVWNTTGINFGNSVYNTITVPGTATYNGNSLTFDAKVEVVKAGTVYFINSGTNGNYNGTSTSVGSDVYDAVKNLVGAANLKNATSDRAFTSGSWGFRTGTSRTIDVNGTNISVTASSNVSGRALPGSYSNLKTESGTYGGNNTANYSYEYAVPLDAGKSYDICVGLADWWSNARTVMVTVENSSGTVLAALNGTAGTSVSAGARTRVIGTIPAISDPDANGVTIRLTARTQSQAPTCSYVIIAEQGLTPPPQKDRLSMEITTLSKSGANVSGTVDIWNYDTEAVSGTAYLAAYDKDGKFLALQEIWSGRLEQDEIALPFAFEAPDTATVKLFLWDDLFVPIIAAQSKSI